MKDKQIDAYLKGQAIGQLLGCAMVAAVMLLMGTGKSSANIERDISKTQDTDVPANVAAPDSVRKIAIDSLQRVR